MKRISFFSRASRWLLVSGLVLSLAGCIKDEEFGEDFDIPWPYPTVTEITPARAEIGTEITIKGTNLDKAITVTVGRNRREAAIVSATATELKITVPRTANAGPVYVKNAYNRQVTSTVLFEPTYPQTTITTWPDVIFRGQSMKLKGENMDLVTAILINGEKIQVEGISGTQTELSVSTEGLTLADDVVLTVEARGGVSNPTSPSIPVQDYDPNTVYDPVPAVVVWDFEDGVNPFVSMDITPENGLNLSGVPGGRGNNYLTVREASVPNAWGTNIGQLLSAPVTLTGFHEPHLTFMINTNGKQGYFQLEMIVGGNKDGGHFTASTSSNPADNYTFQTNGWEWRSISLAEFGWEDWGGDGLIDWSPEATIDLINFTFKQGNGTNPFEISLDQVMITDGARKPGTQIWNFEDGANPYSGSATSGINLTALTNKLQGDSYLTVKVDDNVNSWNWTGAAEYNASVDISQMRNPYLSMWVNTGGRKGYFQVETYQDGTKWGIGQTSPDYLFDTQGQWQRVTIKLAPEVFSNWGGSGTAFDPKAALEYVKIGFTTGNVAGEPYELSIDEVYISDGPLD